MQDAPQPFGVADAVERAILRGTELGQKVYGFEDRRDADRPALHWFQDSIEGRVLFVVFYTQACRWSRCTGCNLPSLMSRKPIGFRALMAQVDALFNDPGVRKQLGALRKVIVSNNGSVLDEATFSSTALIYLIAKLNLHLPQLAVLTLETRVEYVDTAELEFIARALREGDGGATLELAVGFEAFDERIRNEVFRKGLKLDAFERLCHSLAVHGFRLKCYFMLKPVPELTDAAAVDDIARAVAYLDAQAARFGVAINLHLNPTYVAYGTSLEDAFRRGEYTPPRLRDVARAALQAEGTRVSVFLGLSDEGLACAGGSFVRSGDEPLVAQLEVFNRTQDFRQLRAILAEG